MRFVVKKRKYCCNLSVGIALNVIHHERNVRKEQYQYMYVTRTNNNRAIAAHDLYCCSLSQCEALLASRSGFPNVTKWSCDRDVKVVSGATFRKRTCNRCGSLWKGGNTLATSRLALRWMCDLPRKGCVRITTPMYMWHEQSIIEWSRRVISVVAYCHSVKLLRTCRSGFPIATMYGPMAMIKLRIETRFVFLNCQ